MQREASELMQEIEEMKCEISYHKNNIASQQERYENDLKMAIDSLKKAHTRELETCRLNYEQEVKSIQKLFKE
jgi:hypothetical protein